MKIEPYPLPYIVLHWATAGLIILQVSVALYMGSLPDDGEAQNSVERIHVALGLTILTLLGARLILRTLLRTPPLPIGPGPLQLLAKATHAALYVVAVCVTLAGWALKSFFPGQLNVAGLFDWPPLPFLQGLPPETGAPLYGRIEATHIALVWLLAALVLLHVAGVVRHHLKGLPILSRMAP